MSIGFKGLTETKRPVLVGYSQLLCTGNSRLSGVMEGMKVTDNPKSWLKQNQSKHGKNGLNVNFFS
jgi:hypothetical protein